MGTAFAKAEKCDEYEPWRSANDWVLLEGGCLWGRM